MVAAYNFRLWHKNPRIIISFLLAFILCFMLSDKAVRFAQSNNTTMQIAEAFVWTFGDAQSILLVSLLMMLLFADMPFISTATPFFLMRINRRIFLLGQGLYIICATSIFMVFILISTIVVSMTNSFTANIWSKTAATLGYTGIGEKIALPAMLEVMQLSRPYDCMISIFFLMLFYTLLMVFIMLLGNLLKGSTGGVIAAFIFSLYGLFLNPDVILSVLDWPSELEYIANLIVSWISPLNHATYHLHNFGYNKLPTIWQTFIIFFILVVAVFLLCLRLIKKYNFNFTGTES